MIKTKENSIKQATVKDKVIDTTGTHKIKQKENDKKEESTDAGKGAVSSVEHIGEATAFESTRRAKNYVVRKHREKKRAKLIKQKKGISSETLPIDNESNVSVILHNFSENSKKDKRLRNRITLNRTRKTNVPSTRILNQTKQMNQAKALAKSKYQKKVYQSSQQVGKLRSSVNTVTNALSNTFSFVKKSVMSVKNIIGIGTGLLLMTFIVMFIGIFACLSDDSTVNSATEAISLEVVEYRDTIYKYAKQYEMEEYVTLIQAVMMNESEGKGKDPMQSSLLEYNTKYPKKKNGITDAEYSIDVGVHYLSDCFKLAKPEGPYDMDNISLMIQGYNYGKDYITWAQKHFNGYTRANAKVYSDEKRAELQVETFGDPKYVSHVFRYYHLGNGDIVMVAKSQVGNVGGKPYWSWYGFKERVEWCACFVSWCANESEQLNVTIPKFAAVSDGIKWYKDKGLFKTKGYTPKPGDLIFFDWEQDGKSDHVGIVESVDYNNVYTIEGNSTDDECRQKTYSLASKSIFGYGVINK